MRVRVVLQVVLIAIAFGAALAAWLPFTSLGGAADDAAAARRARMFGARSMEDAASVVIALDSRSLRDERLAATPRALMTPVWAALSEKALAHGADKVALDFISSIRAKSRNVALTPINVRVPM